MICELSLFVVAFLDSMAAPEIFSLGLLWFSSLPKANRATLSVTALPLLMVNFILFISIISWCDVSAPDVFLTFDLFTASFDSSPNERFR